MTGSRVQHLQRRDGIFHLRVSVPHDIRPLVGLTEVRRSLRTYQRARARTLAAVFAARLFEVFDMAKTNDLPKDRIRSLIRNVFDDMKRETERSTSTSLSDYDLNEQLYCSNEMTAMIRVQRAIGAHDHHARSIADRSLASAGVRSGDLSATSHDDIMDGATRAFVERERLYRFRLTDRLAAYLPADPLFSQEAETPSLPQTMHAMGPMLGEAIDTYLSVKRKSWTVKTYAIRDRYLGYLREHFGDNRSLCSISSADIREYRDAITRMRRNSGKAIRQTFAEKQTANAAHRISDSTVALIFVPTQAFLRWCLSDQGYIERNPAENIRVAVAKKPKGKRSRRPFTAADFTQLFTAPNFTGCLSSKRRFTAGAVIVRDAHYWIPILAFYSACRLGELVQLHIADVFMDGDIPYLHITEDGGGAPDQPDAKHVKSEAGVRRVPLHDDLIDLGFLDFVQKRRSQKKGSKRLFPEIKFGKDGQASTVFSKWFSRLMNRAGLIDPALVFHSMRHNAEDAFRDARQPQYVIDKIFGHSDGATSSQYGEGVSLEVMYEAVMAMRLKVRLPQLWEST